MEKLIIESLKAVERAFDFDNDELAYLALTSKVERPIRDRWAFELYKNINPNFIVSREWLSTDLAILDNLVPRALIELKAMYSFNALNEKTILRYVDLMKKDTIKAKELALRTTSTPQIYTVLLATHPHASVGTKFKKVIKYSLGINKAFKDYENAENIKKTTNDKVNTHFSEWHCIANGSFVGGKAFEINTEVLFWLFKI